MRAPSPAARVLRRRRGLVLIEPREIHPPDVTVLWWQRSTISQCQPFHAWPRKCQLNSPAIILVAALVQSSIHVYGSLQSWKVPGPGTHSRSTRMCFEPNAVERSDFRIGAREFWNACKTSLFVSLFPNEKHFVNGVEGVDLEFIVAVFSGDKKFDVVVLVDWRIPFSQSCHHVRLFHPISDIEIFVVPEQRRSCVVQCSLPANEIDKTRGARHRSPAVLIENSIDIDWIFQAIGRVMRNGFVVTRQGCLLLTCTCV